MKFVVDTNILFTFFWKNSFTKGILVDQDFDFIALAIKLNCPVWSNDPHLKQQSLVKVFNTNEFIKEFNSSE